jgi:hypothetical protein
MACDVCGKTGKPTTNLRDIYQTPEIQVVCDDCGSIIDNQLRKLQTMTGRIQRALLRRFMADRKHGKPHEPPAAREQGDNNA